MKKSLIFIIVAGLLFLASYFFVKKLDTESKTFKADLELLKRSNDSLNNLIQEQTTTIISLHTEAEELTEIIETKKDRVKIITVEVEKKKEEAQNYDSSQIVQFFKTRYPEEAAKPDTAIHLSKPILTSAAVDLVSYDGAKETMVVKDSIAALQDKKIVIKDSVITLMSMNEKAYKHIIGNKDTEIAKWSTQYNLLQLQNKKLKIQTKFARVATVVLLGGLTYTLIAR